MMVVLQNQKITVVDEIEMNFTSSPSSPYSLIDTKDNTVVDNGPDKGRQNSPEYGKHDPKANQFDDASHHTIPPHV